VTAAAQLAIAAIATNADTVRDLLKNLASFEERLALTVSF
jgi:hypothetical protein